MGKGCDRPRGPGGLLAMGWGRFPPPGTIPDPIPCHPLSLATSTDLQRGWEAQCHQRCHPRCHRGRHPGIVPSAGAFGGVLGGSRGSWGSGPLCHPVVAGVSPAPLCCCAPCTVWGPIGVGGWGGCCATRAALGEVPGPPARSQWAVTPQGPRNRGSWAGGSIGRGGGDEGHSPVVAPAWAQHGAGDRALLAPAPPAPPQQMASAWARRRELAGREGGGTQRAGAAHPLYCVPPPPNP